MVMVAVKFDEYSSIVCAVTVGQRLQERQVLQRHELAQLVLLEALLGLLRRAAAPMRPLQLLVLRPAPTRS